MSNSLPGTNNNRQNTPSDVKEEKGDDSLTISRRTFLNASAVAATAIAASYILKQPQLALAAPSETTSEGVITEQWIATSCLNCPTRCATKVRVVNGKAVRIAGNPLSKVSEGENCPRSHIGLQVLYNPNRIKTPLKRTNTQKGKDIDPGWIPISWEQALSDIAGRLKMLRENGDAHKLLLMYGLNSISNEDLIKRFATAYGTPNIVYADGLENEADKAGQWMADGNYTTSAYDLEHTNYIISFGASIIESQKPVARNIRFWGKIRRERPNRVKVVVIDPRYSVTAAKSDQWLPINPGTDGALALAIANVIIDEELYDQDFIQNHTTGFDEFKKLVLDYSPEKVAGITGITTDAIRTLAREFALTRPAIAMRGRGATCWPDGSYTSYAVFCLNALVGSIDIPGGVIYQEYPDYRDLPQTAEDTFNKEGLAQPALDLHGKDKFFAARAVTNQVADSILSGSPYTPEMAIGINANFNMMAPGTERWNEAMSKIRFYVHITPAFTEMSEYADIILPACTFLEEWGYEHCPPGSGFYELKIKQPVVKPLYSSMSIGDIIFTLADLSGDAMSASFSGVGNNAEGFARYRTGTVLNWDKLIDDGVMVGPTYKYNKYDQIFRTPSQKFEFYSGNMELKFKENNKWTGDRTACLPHYQNTRFLGDTATYPLILVNYHPLLDVNDGNQNYPWAQEIYMVMHGYGWTNFVEINEQTAHGLRIKDGDTVWVESPFHKIKARARVFQGIHPQVVAIAHGQGHYYSGKWADGMGVNPNDIIGVDYDFASGQSSVFNTRVRIYRA